MGYSTYESYRKWLEDEFHFRCIYCLNRKVWSPTNIWAIDHLVPQDEAPELECEYDNLIFACQFCNQQKLSNRVPDPCRVAYGACLRVETNGMVIPLNAHGKRLVSVIRLNHPRFVEERRKTMKLLCILAKHNRAAYEQMMGFPEDLPDLSTLKPPRGNRRPEGISESCFVRKQRHELPSIY
jgi:hypothetical protein